MRVTSFSLAPRQNRIVSGTISHISSYEWMSGAVSAASEERQLVIAPNDLDVRRQVAKWY